MPADEILEDLHAVAELEHAHLVYHLRLHYALGGERPERGDVVPSGVRDAAEAAMLTAQVDMGHLKHVNRVLVRAGAEPVLGRAPAGVQRMTPAQFTHFPARELALAGDVDRAYGRIRAHLTSAGPPFTGPLLDDLTNLLDVASDHAGATPALAAHLSGLGPDRYLFVTGEEPDGEIERRLLALSDEFYGSLLMILREHFADVDELGPPLRPQAISRMEDMHAVNEILALHGLLPAFTLP